MSIFDRFFNLFNQIFQANPFSNTLKDLKVQTETMLQRKGEAENLLREHNAQYTLAVEALAIIQKEKESVLAELNLKNEKLEIFHNSMQEEEIAALELEIRTLEQKKSVVLIAYEEAQKKKDELEKKIKDTKIMVQEANKNFDTIDAKYQAAKIQETFSPFIK
ncbi:MAG: hypothetical protein JWM09_148, partial [Francisellaceae bacterium]|nr:hypothetical protein [Francisellaceae bacterium]